PAQAAGTAGAPPLVEVPPGQPPARAGGPLPLDRRPHRPRGRGPGPAGYPARPPRRLGSQPAAAPEVRGEAGARMGGGAGWRRGAMRTPPPPRTLTHDA